MHLQGTRATVESADSQASGERRHTRGGGGGRLEGSKNNVNSNVNTRSSVDVSNLFCYYTNVDSLSNKWDEFCADIKSKGREPDIIMLTEVLPKNFRFQLTRAEIALQGYEMFPESFPNNMSRGTVIYIKETLKAVEVKFDTNFEESTWVKINLKGTDCLLCGCIYKSPSNSAVNEVHLRNLLKHVAENRQFSHVVVAGDLNYPDIKWENCNAEKEESELFLECLRDCFWYQHVQDFTRFRINQQPSVLDLIMTNEEDMVVDLEYLSPLGASDHNPDSKYHWANIAY